uniref:Accessory gland protein Acp29AB-like n=1 Tax=Drosophila rhopaloa TaxID=1041015 RepID=A0A6P4FL56_DRORH
MAKSEYNSTECGPFIHEALHPIRHRIANLREQVESQTAALNKTLTDMERILNAIVETKEKLDRIEAKLEGNPEPDTPGFERIGSRYFFIEHEDRKSWTGAEIACRQKGGYLAAFQNQEELDEIKEKLQVAVYWLGINQKIKEGDFVSVASGKPATFLDW